MSEQDDATKLSKEWIGKHLSPELRMIRRSERLDARITAFDTETRRRMTLIIDRQAALVASQKKSNERIEQIGKVVRHLSLTTESRFRSFEDSLTRLADSQIKLHEAQRRTEAAVASLSEAQAQTDKRLKELLARIRTDR